MARFKDLTGQKFGGGGCGTGRKGFCELAGH